jgi:hypothetical protein
MCTSIVPPPLNVPEANTIQSEITPKIYPGPGCDLTHGHGEFSQTVFNYWHKNTRSTMCGVFQKSSHILLTAFA